MIQNRKRIPLMLIPLLAVLILAAILVLAGGNREEEEPVPSTTAAAETTPPPVTPEAAAAKLSDANSFRLTISMLNSADAYSYENIYHFQMAKAADSTQTVLFSQYTKMTANGSTTETTGDQAYYQGSTAYIQYAYGASPVTTRWHSEEVYALATVVEEQSGLPIHAVGKSMITAFSALSPVLTTYADGSSSYLSLNLPAEQFETVYSAFAGEAATKELLESAGEYCMFNIKASIDSEGYLTQFKLEVLNIANSEGTQNITVLFTMDEINASNSIPAPSYAEDFSLTAGGRAVYSHGDQNANYYFSSIPSEGGNPVAGLVFGGFSSSLSADGAVAYYEVLSQIDGISVAEVQKLLVNSISGVTVQRLVIPTGVKVNIQGVYLGSEFITNTSETVLFFTDKEEDVEKTFLVEGETAENQEAVFFKAAYYAGQWEYVDGIPTPNN